MQQDPPLNTHLLFYIPNCHKPTIRKRLPDGAHSAPHGTTGDREAPLSPAACASLKRCLCKQHGMVKLHHPQLHMPGSSLNGCMQLGMGELFLMTHCKSWTPHQTEACREWEKLPLLSCSCNVAFLKKHMQMGKVSPYAVVHLVSSRDSARRNWVWDPEPSPAGSCQQAVGGFVSDPWVAPYHTPMLICMLEFYAGQPQSWHRPRLPTSDPDICQGRTVCQTLSCSIHNS